MITFVTDPDCKENFKPLSVVSANKKLTRELGSVLEQCSDSLVSDLSFPSLMGLSHESFKDHHHMVLTPDTVWLTIESGLKNHILQNAEELRSKFVDSDGGKFNIEIIRNGFVKGQTNNWEGCFDEFSEKIGDLIGPQKDLIVGNFSTTSDLQRVSSEIVLMDMMKEYFTYSVMTRCGIPRVTLEGTVEDWENIRDRFNQFKNYGLDWWVDVLDPILEQLVESSKGNVSLDFWRSWHKEYSMSGGTRINGNIVKFYPYNKNYKGDLFKSDFKGGNISNFPISISQVPFVWDYYGKKISMEFAGGIIGIGNVPGGGVKCEYGWAVRECVVLLKNYPIDKLETGIDINCTDGNEGSLVSFEIKDFSKPPYNRKDVFKQINNIKVKWKDGVVEDILSYYDKFNTLFVK